MPLQLNGDDGLVSGYLGHGTAVVHRSSPEAVRVPDARISTRTRDEQLLVDGARSRDRSSLPERERIVDVPLEKTCPSFRSTGGICGSAVFGPRHITSPIPRSRMRSGGTPSTNSRGASALVEFVVAPGATAGRAQRTGRCIAASAQRSATRWSVERRIVVGEEPAAALPSLDA